MSNIIETPLKLTKTKKETCIVCGSPKIMKSYSGVCSKTCLDDKLHYDNMNIPMLFVKNLFLRCPDTNEREKQIVNFAAKHKYNLPLVKRKLEIIVSQINCA